MKLRNTLPAVCVALYASIAFGQATNSADLTGTVTDPSGAVIPGVTISVKDVDKGIEKSYTTNEAGLYDTGPLFADDHYTVTFSKEGFATLQRGPMALNVGRLGLDAQLGIAKTSQQIQVTSDAPLLQTATPELSTTLPQETLQELPQTGSPDWQQNIILLPGTQGNSGNAPNPGMGGVSANGSMPYSSSLLDGGMENSPQADNVIIIPVFDAIAEVKISDSLFSAQYPTGGIMYNQITKGGTNTIHGMATEYLRNTAFNAYSYVFTPPSFKPITHFNDFGFNLGGPVIKNRAFLFFDWDHAISHGLGAPAYISVPTNAERSGDFTGLATIYDPTTQVVSGATVTRQSFASEFGNGNKIPQNLISSVAQNIQGYFPAPNLPGTVNNYHYQLPSQSTVQKYFGRADVDITQNNRITGSAAESLNHTLSNSPVCPINCFANATSNVTSQLSDYWTISPRTLNEARFGFYAEYDSQIYSTLGQGYPAKLGLQYAKADAFPTISISNIYGFGPGVLFIDKENLFDMSDTVTLVRGRHSIHVGAQFVPERVDANPYSGTSAANLGFTGGYTASSNGTSSTTGSSYADFLLGYAHSWSANVYPEYGGRLKSGSGFVQDDWKFTPKLTLNLGLRYEARTGWSEVHGNMRLFDPTLNNPATNTLGAMWYASTHTNGRTAAEAPRVNNWYPRVGFAYQLSPTTTLRGGFGIYAYQWNANWDNPGIGQAGGSNGNETDATNNVNPVVTLDDSGNTNFQGASGSAINARYQSAPNSPTAYNGQGVGYQQYHSPIPIVKEWNADVQQQLTTNMMFELAYVGSRGTTLPFVIDINQVPESLLSPKDSPGSRPYPQYQGITGFTPQAVSNYNALEATIARRMTHGLEVNANYTWSHFLDTQDSSGWNSLQGTQSYQRSYDPSANYGASNFDVRNAFKAQAIYQLPFGKGRMWFKQSGLADEVIGGWSASATYVGQGGHPFTPAMSVNNSYAQAGSWYPNQIANPIPANRGINGWFNTAAFQAPAAGTFGNMRRNSVYGPGLQEMNASVHKRFPIVGERIGFDFSANATNVLNHPSFGQPDSTIGPGHTATIRSLTVGGRTMEFVGKVVF